jgi:hypothetical protein
MGTRDWLHLYKLLTVVQLQQIIEVINMEKFQNVQIKLEIKFPEKDDKA